MVYRLRINPKPAHFFGKAVVVISRIDHNGRIAFAVEEDVRHPFAHAGNILVDPAGVQRLEDLLAPVHPAHCFSLKFRCLFRHDHTSFLCCDAKPAPFIFVVLDLTKSCLLQIRFTVHNAILFTRCATALGDRPAIPRVASSAHGEQDVQNAADTGHDILRPFSGRKKYGSRYRAHGSYPAAE